MEVAVCNKFGVLVIPSLLADFLSLGLAFLLLRSPVPSDAM